MTTFYLIRHAMHDLVGRALAGRKPGVRLNDAGRREAQRLAERLSLCPIDFVYSSPQERTQETAGALWREVKISGGLDEIDFGAWTGRTFAELEADPEWPVWVHRRSAAHPPGGETIVQAQQRIVGEMTSLAESGDAKTFALFSHGDVIKAALAHLLEMSLDHLERIEIAPASISIVSLGGGYAQVHCTNDLAHLRP